MTRRLKLQLFAVLTVLQDVLGALKELRATNCGPQDLQASFAPNIASRNKSLPTLFA
jgi:hypothetical protein